MGWLDIIIDRISSCIGLVTAARVVSSGEFASLSADQGQIATFVFYASAIFVEVIAHAVVCYCADVLEMHQKELGFDYAIVKLYLGSKKMLFYACVSFEVLTMAVIINMPLLAIL